MLEAWRPYEVRPLPLLHVEDVPYITSIARTVVLRLSSIDGDSHCTSLQTLIQHRSGELKGDYLCDAHAFYIFGECFARRQSDAACISFALLRLAQVLINSLPGTEGSSPCSTPSNADLRRLAREKTGVVLLALMLRYVILW